MTPEDIKRLRELEAPDCGDNSCRFAKKRGGMRTNGGCGCLENGDQRARLYFGAIHQALPALLDEIARLREMGDRLAAAVEEAAGDLSTVREWEASK